jgi:hypothetical protein
MRVFSGIRGVSQPLCLFAVVCFLVAPAIVVPVVVVVQRPDPVSDFRTIQPGMKSKEVQAVLVRPHVAYPLAWSFGTPTAGSEAVLRGEPSFIKREWGRVDDPFQYEPEWARSLKAHTGQPLSSAELQMVTMRQWGVANTQSYSFIAVFDENDVLVCRYWTTPTESRFRGWLRRVVGW